MRPNGVRPVFWFAALMVVLIGSAASALPPPACPAGRFAVAGSPLLGFGADGSDAVSYNSAGDVWTDTGCAPVIASKLRGSKRGTKIRATWPTGCGVNPDRIVLIAIVDNETCDTMTGTFKYKDAGKKIRRGFVATRVDDGTCDDGGIGAFPLIQSRILYARGCNVSTCHSSATPSGGLDLSQEAAHLNIVNVAAANAAAAAAGKKRVLPNDPDASFLMQKLDGTLGTGEGARMPLIGPQLPADERQLVRAWIAAGAPATGRVPNQPCLPPNEYVETPAPPPPSGGYQLVLEGPWLQPGEEHEGCLWIPTPNTNDFLAGKWEFALNPGTHHFAVFDWDKPGAPITNVWRPGDIGCISGADFGQTISGSPQAPYFVATYPAGIARLLPSGRYLGLNAHYRNYWEVPIQMRVYINIHPFQGTPQHLADTIVDFLDMFSISVPVNTQKIQPGRWHNFTGGPLYVYSVTGHMHQRGLRFTAKRSNGTIIYENFDFAHPIFREFVPPIVLNNGDWIDYECLHDNGVTKPVRRDGAGNPTTLVFGTTTEDEMCTLNGEFYRQ
jgi:hypothetical protein